MPGAKTSATHGLAAEIRRTTEPSATFDLGGMTSDTIETIVRDAFSEPLPPLEDEAKMIRLTFVVGAGKQARQKYDANAMKVLTSTLQNECGYVQDRGASAVLECAGSYKLQHDTGKNLKTVVVFPKLRGHGDGPGGGGGSTQQEQPLFPDSSVQHKVAIASLLLFQNMVQHKVPSWSQKKNLMLVLEDLHDAVQECDSALMQGTPLTAAQQGFYDGVTELAQKMTFLKDQMATQVEEGRLTKPEHSQLLNQNAARIHELEEHYKPTEKLEQRRKLLEQINPLPLPPLKHHAELGKLWKQAGPLMKFQEELQKSGRLLSVKETQQLAKLEELMAEIEDLEETSRGFLEDDEIFSLRVSASRKEFARFIPKSASNANKGSKATGGRNVVSFISSSKGRSSSNMPVTKWITPQSTAPTKAAKKKSRLQKGDVFGAMALNDDDDTDSDSYNDDGGGKEEPEANVLQTPSGESSKQTAAVNNTSTSKNKNKKKNQNKNRKKKNVGNQKNTKEEDAIDQIAREAEARETTSNLVVRFVSFVLSILLEILKWLLSLVFGSKPKKEKAT